VCTGHELSPTEKTASSGSRCCLEASLGEVFEEIAWVTSTCDSHLRLHHRGPFDRILRITSSIMESCRYVIQARKLN